MYEVMVVDFKWFEYMNVDELFEGKGLEVCMMTLNVNYMRLEYLEKFFDVFEEMFWVVFVMLM